MSTIKTAVCEITPEWAKQQLDKLDADQTGGNFRQRAARDRAIQRYAQDMKSGKWVLTHQGIAFDDLDHLIDGQNRLWAVVRSKCTVPMLVTTGIPHNGKLTAMDVIDGGTNRTLSQCLQVSHGYNSEACELSMLAKQIVRMIQAAVEVGPRFRVLQVSVAQALFIIEELNYRNSFERISNIIELRKLRAGPLMAPLCWYHMIRPRKAEQFARDYASLQGLETGSPPLIMFRYFSNTSSARRMQLNGAEKQSIVALAIQRYEENQTLDKPTVSVGRALKWLVNENKDHAEKITKRLIA